MSLRTSSFSNPTIIDLLSKYYVPAILETRDPGSLPPAEWAEFRRLCADCDHQKIIWGYICSYVIKTDGTVAESLPLHSMDRPSVTALLQREIKKLDVQPRTPEQIRALAAQSPGPGAPKRKLKDSVMLHMLARYHGSHAHQEPTNEWIEVIRDDWLKFLPSPGKATIGASWEVAHGAAERLLNHFYPPDPSYPLGLSHMEQLKVEATLVTVTPDEFIVRLAGQMEMSRRPNGVRPQMVTAKLFGVVRYNRQSDTITIFSLLSENAQFQVWSRENGPLRKVFIPFSIFTERVMAP
jgi:hypothetical protein